MSYDWAIVVPNNNNNNNATVINIIINNKTTNIKCNNQEGKRKATVKFIS